MMYRPRSKLFLAVALACFITIAPSFTQAQDVYPAEPPTASTMLFDLTVVRPVGLVSMALGTAAYVVSLPFTLLGGNAGEAFDKLMKEPTRYTFRRPLGQI